MKSANQLQVSETAEGDLFFTIPDDLLDRLGWQEGDEVKFVEHGDGFIIKKTRYETVELEFEEDELFKFMKAAHEHNMSFNELCETAVQEAINRDEQDRTTNKSI